MSNKINYKKSELFREALVVVANDNSIAEDYKLKDAIIELLACELSSVLSHEEWEAEREAERKAKEEAENVNAVRLDF